MPSLSEHDLRFALLVDIMSFGRRRGPRGRRSRLSAEEEAVMDPNERPVVSEANQERVRAGVTGHGYVLIFGTALVIVLFIAVAAFVKS